MKIEMVLEVQELSDQMTKNNDFIYGLKRGMPICLGYIPVAFTFGFMAVEGGLAAWVAILMSITNLTSAGQFAGLGIILQNGSFVELAITTLIINLRYMLMSLSLSQRVEEGTSMGQRAIMSFGVTDEIFAIASTERGDISYTYMLGLMITPIFGWTFGTAMGGLISSVLPIQVQNAMGIALYAMFIAIVIPAAKKSKEIIVVVAIAVFVNSLIFWVPALQNVSSGWRIIVTTIIAASIGATMYPQGGDHNE